MSQSLNELFSALVQSEQAAEAEKFKYEEAKRNTQLATEKLHKETANRNELTEEIQTLENSLDGVETGTDELTHTETFLREKTRKMRSENSEKAKGVVNLQDTLKAQSLKFMDQVQKFSEKYGLSNNTKEKRLENARLNLKKVAAEMDVVEKEINEKNIRLAEINQLLAKREELMEANEKLTIAENDIHANIRSEEVQIRQLQKESLMLQAAPESGEEFSQVTEDLEKYKTEKLENKAEKLHAQLSDVADKVRRQEGQTLRQQYKRWQRERQLRQVEWQQQQQPSNISNQNSQNNDALYPTEAQTDPQPLEISLDGDQTILLPHTDRPGFGTSTGEAQNTQRREPSRDVGQTSLRNTGGGNTPNLVWGEENPKSDNEDTNYCAIENKKNRSDLVNDESHRDSFGTSLPQAEDTDEFSAAFEDGGLMSSPQKMISSAGCAEQVQPELIFSQEDILCPSASTVSESADRSHREFAEGSSQNTIFISSPN